MILFVWSPGKSFFAIGVPNYLVLWNVNFAVRNARRPAGRKMGLKNFIVRPVKNTSRAIINIWHAGRALQR